MAQESIRVTGLKETIRKFEKMGVEVSDMKDSMRKLGDMVADDARSLAPKLSGALAGSIRPSNAKNKAMIRAGGAKIPYAGVIHYGGYHGIAPHPFLNQAIGQNQSRLVNTLEDELRGLIKKVDLK